MENNTSKYPDVIDMLPALKPGKGLASWIVKLLHMIARKILMPFQSLVQDRKKIRRKKIQNPSYYDCI